MIKEISTLWKRKKKWKLSLATGVIRGAIQPHSAVENEHLVKAKVKTMILSQDHSPGIKKVIYIIIQRNRAKEIL